MNGHEYLEIKKLCEDLEKEIKKRVVDNPNYSIRTINYFSRDYCDYLKIKLNTETAKAFLIPSYKPFLVK